MRRNHVSLHITCFWAIRQFGSRECKESGSVVKMIMDFLSLPVCLSVLTGIVLPHAGLIPSMAMVLIQVRVSMVWDLHFRVSGGEVWEG